MIFSRGYSLHYCCFGNEFMIKSKICILEPRLGGDFCLYDVITHKGCLKTNKSYIAGTCVIDFYLLFYFLSSIFHVLITQKSPTVGMHSAILRNHLEFASTHFYTYVEWGCESQVSINNYTMSITRDQTRTIQLWVPHCNPLVRTPPIN